MLRETCFTRFALLPLHKLPLNMTVLVIGGAGMAGLQLAHLL
jgi:hypothetical protein